MPQPFSVQQGSEGPQSHAHGPIGQMTLGQTAHCANGLVRNAAGVAACDDSGGTSSSGGHASAPPSAGSIAAARREGCGTISPPPRAHWRACRGRYRRDSCGGLMRPYTSVPTGPTSTAACAPTGHAYLGSHSTMRRTSATRCKSAAGPCSRPQRSSRMQTPRRRRGRRPDGSSCGLEAQTQGGCWHSTSTAT